MNDAMDEVMFFSHGQLYVGCSQVSCERRLCIFIKKKLKNKKYFVQRGFQKLFRIF